ncbi:MAG TPA: tRNA (guanosine(37)-N1)-methyltransferase TrmD [Firmicutes bacterium]|jgi:tRNA (guanine37-N1)-methyltransferase|nr:tRNA (guanosine(37)-N1)-methyltransferase TrmD [Bacillota bacterium]HBK60394.1 tRNA (guanosine(37)-N1)-methyltransferase TrmD [Bacillota bacterium]
MEIDILTIFPGMFSGVMSESILGRAQEKGILTVRVHDIRDFAAGKHRVVDDYPFGGGPGMVMKPEPIAAAVHHALECRESAESGESRVILTTPAGRPFTQDVAKEFAACEHLVILCGHYEGIDERVATLVTEEISIGDYVLTGGELPAMVIVDAAARLLPDALGDEASAAGDSFWDGLLDYPHYTRPRQWRELEVPEVLISGDHEKIRQWRRARSLERTQRRRPDLLARAELSAEDLEILRTLAP